MNEVLLAQLIGMKAQLDALYSQLDAAITLAGAMVDSQPCQHPQDKRKDISGMGIKRWRCAVCGHIEEVR